jgi:hypothetical protein
MPRVSVKEKAGSTAPPALCPCESSSSDAVMCDRFCERLVVKMGHDDRARMLNKRGKRLLAAETSRKKDYDGDR